MTTSSRNDCSQASTAGRGEAIEGVLSLEEYVAESTQKLEAFTNQVRRGEALDPDSRDWILDQVNFIVEAVGDDSLDLGGELRSNLLQLLMAIANLNEHIRHQTYLGLLPH